MSLKGLKKRFSIRTPSNPTPPTQNSAEPNKLTLDTANSSATGSTSDIVASPTQTSSATDVTGSGAGGPSTPKRSHTVKADDKRRTSVQLGHASGEKRNSVVLGYVQANKDRLVAEHERSPLPPSSHIASPHSPATPHHPLHGVSTKGSLPTSGVASPNTALAADGGQNVSAGMTPSGEVEASALQATLAKAVADKATSPAALQLSSAKNVDVAVADAADTGGHPFAPGRNEQPPDEGYGLGSTAAGEVQANWGTFPIVPDHTKAWKQLKGRKRESLLDINSKRTGETVLLRARIHHVRSMGSKLVFLVLRQEYLTVQAVVQATVHDDPTSRPTSLLNGTSTSNTSAAPTNDGHDSIPAAPQPSATTTETITGRLAAAVGLKKASDEPAPFAAAESEVDGRLADSEQAKDQGATVDSSDKVRNAVLAEGSAAAISKEAGVDIPEQMIRWAEKLPRESVVLVEAIVKSPKPYQNKVKGAEIHDVELAVLKLFVIGTVTQHTPFSVEDAAQADENENVTLGSGTGPGRLTRSLSTAGKAKRRTHIAEAIKINNRIITLRTPASHATFYLVSRAVAAFESSLVKKGFVGIHSPKLQGGATESGADVFKVGYFGRDAFLAQSPQLAKQMAVGSGLERVFEVGPVFRAENSNTHRHLTEFTGLDIEMAFEEHYSEVRETINATLLEVFRVLENECQHHVDIIRKQFPASKLVIKGVKEGEQALRLTFKEGVDMLRASGFKIDGKEVPYYEDFNTATEKELGRLVKQKYGTDYYMLDKFPLSARPFYTMPDPDDAMLSNSFDFFLRGEEILSGGQRIHHAPLLEARMKAVRINPQSMSDYLSAFAWGMPQHGGAGVGLERIIMLYLGVGNVRRTSMFPRDPRSFQTSGLGNKKAKKNEDLREVTTRVKEDGTKEFPDASLEALIASYGDSPNTAWLDEGYTIFRHARTGAAIGFLTHGNYAICWGRPLCEDSQLPEVLADFLAWLKAGGSGKKKLHLPHPHFGHHKHDKHEKESSHDHEVQRVDTTDTTASTLDSGLDPEADKVEGAGGLSPIWTCLDTATERVLAKNHGWRSLICIAEDRVDPVHAPRWIDTPQVGRKMRQAMRAGVEVEEFEGTSGLPDDLMKKIDVKLQQWNAARQTKGDQIHVTDLRPFIDMPHRRYFVGRVSKEAAQAAEKKARSTGADGQKHEADVEDGKDDEKPKKKGWGSRKKDKKQEKDKKKKDKAEKKEKAAALKAGADVAPDVSVQDTAATSDGTDDEVVGLIVLSKLSPEHGYQLKWSLEFPNAPTGTSELCISHALDALRRDGVETATFGTGATGRVDPGGNVNVMAIRVLSKTYQALAKRFRLNQKSGYRMKFGAKEDPLYVAFPKSGLNYSGIDALIKALEH